MEAATRVAGVPGQRRPRDVLVAGERTRVWRQQDPATGEPVVCKEALGPQAAARTAHETAVLARLAGIAGVPRLVPGRDPHVLVLADEGGRPLAETSGGERWQLGRALAVALRLARVLAAVHDAGVIHRDLHPGNVLIGPDGVAGLIDFDLATTFAEVRPGFTHESEIVGVLPYLAPEQTGRTAWSVDSRADLYALGAVLYELVSGRPPFVEESPLDLVRSVLGRAPDPLTRVAPGTPPGVAALVATLLAKEPGRRYQSAAGVAHDLALLLGDPFARFPLAAHDFPRHLTGPAQLVGRTRERALLVSALDDVVSGAPTGRGSRPGRRAVLVAGAPGVGKSALIDELRTVVTERGGWFVSGKSDQVHRDASGAVPAALAGLVRLLLAEPDAALAQQTQALRDRLGTNAAQVARLVPDLRQVLGDQAGPDDVVPAEARDRFRRGTVDLVAALASPRRPVVLFLDDLQWAGPETLELVDALIIEDALPGLLVVGAYRRADVDQAHPLTAMIDRWARLGRDPLLLPLEDLPDDDVAGLLATVLRLGPTRARSLAAVVGERTGGNPFDTIELLNALRRDGVLTLEDGGWTWDEARIRRHAEDADVLRLVGERIGLLPPESADVLSAMACLGNEAGLELLATATGRSEGELRTLLTRALETGLLVPVADDGPEGPLRSVRFRHDRVQETAYRRVAPRERADLHLALGRRLASAGAGLPAAVQYLTALRDGAVPAPGEVPGVIALLRDAARAEQVINPGRAEQFLATARRLWDELGASPDDPAWLPLHAEHLAILVQVGRAEEADGIYAEIAQRYADDPWRLVDATCTQITGLTNRQRPDAAVALGLDLLARLGVSRPDDPRAVPGRVHALTTWAERLSVDEDVARPQPADPRALAVARLLDLLATPAFFCDPDALAWIVVEASRLWQERGPAPELYAALGHANITLIALQEDYRTGYRLLRHLMTVGEARGWETAVAHTRFLFVVSCGHWIEPLEDCLLDGLAAREALVHGGDLQQAGWADYAPVLCSLETATTIEAVTGQVDRAVALADRNGNLLTLTTFRIVRRFLDALRGGTASPTTLAASPQEDAEFAGIAQAVPLVANYRNLFLAMAGVLADDDAVTAEHAGPAYHGVQVAPGCLPIAMAALPYGIHLAQTLRESDDPATRAEATAALDSLLAWLRARAADQPDNYRHLLLLVQAEQAWTAGDLLAAAQAFDAALVDLHGRSRPWHTAVLASRVARFYRTLDLPDAALRYLELARSTLRLWGACALVEELERRHPALRDATSTGRGLAAFPSGGAVAGSPNRVSRALTNDALDHLAVLRAAQALASQTDLDRLHATITDQLRAVTGATEVRLAVHDAAHGWSVWHDGRPVPLAEAHQTGLLSEGLFRYTQRSGRALRVDDAVRDDRFARDPYVARLERCSVLAVPVQHSGELRAVLVLTNELAAGAFTADRLDAVTLLTGQLAVALDNARLYADLEHRIAERTAELEAANRRLELLSVTDPLTGVANRRQFDGMMAEQWTLARAAGRPLAVVMVDIDHFKPYNDAFGHQRGDECLRAVSAALRGVVAPVGVLCRYGGEEFAAVLPDTPAGQAAGLAERMRAAVEATALPHLPEIGRVTVSLGVAAQVPDGGGPAALIDAADAALYRAKDAGRNRVVTGADVTDRDGSDRDGSDRDATG